MHLTNVVSVDQQAAKRAKSESTSQQNGILNSQKVDDLHCNGKKKDQEETASFSAGEVSESDQERNVHMEVESNTECKTEVGDENKTKGNGNKTGSRNATDTPVDKGKGIKEEKENSKGQSSEEEESHSISNNAGDSHVKKEKDWKNITGKKNPQESLSDFFCKYNNIFLCGYTRKQSILV